MARPLRHEAIDEWRSTADRTEDIVSSIAREECIDFLLAAEAVVHRLDRLHVERSMRPWMVRRHGATNIDRSEVVVRFEQWGAECRSENGRIATLISDSVVFDHREAMKCRCAASGGAGDDRGIETSRHTDEYRVKAGRPASNAVERDGAEALWRLPHMICV